MEGWFQCYFTTKKAIIRALKRRKEEEEVGGKRNEGGKEGREGWRDRDIGKGQVKEEEEEEEGDIITFHPCL